MQAARPELDRDQAADEFYRAGIRYLASLDAWISSLERIEGKDLLQSRYRKRVAEASLLRLFPDRFAEGPVE